MSDDTRMMLLHRSTNELVEELLMWKSLAAEYSARIAELEAERRWIPVGEKPLEAGTFFVLLKNGEVTKDLTFIDGGRYYWWNHGANITHYMPLPKLPEATHDR